MVFWQYAEVFKELKSLTHEELLNRLPDVLARILGQCQLPLDHRGPLFLCPDDPTIGVPDVHPDITQIGCENMLDYSSLVVCAPGSAGNSAIDNTNSTTDFPIVSGGFSAIFCGPVYNETTITNNFYVDFNNFYDIDNTTIEQYIDNRITVNAYEWTFTGDASGSVQQTVTDGENVEFTGQANGPIECLAQAGDGLEIRDNGMIKIGSNDTTWDHLEDKADDTSNWNASHDLEIYYETQNDGGNELAKWFIDASLISQHDATESQVLGHASGAWKWFTVDNC